MTDIAAITEREVALIARFVELLKEEQDNLRGVDPAQLPELGSAKAALVEQLNSLEDQRINALAMPAGDKPRAAMEKWLAANPEQLAAAVNWTKLLTLAEEARQLHHLNASLLAIHLQRTQEALAILHGRAASETLYGSDGQAATASGSRIVDSA